MRGLWLLLLLLTRQSLAVCPPRCSCDDEALLADCTAAQLDSFPIALHPRLLQLQLADNAIRRLDVGAVSSYGQLQLLDLSGNGLVLVRPGTFRFQSALLELRLAHNQLSRLDVGCFRGLRQLQLLDLSHNELRQLPADLLTAAEQLQQLNLAGNQLSQLSFETPPSPISIQRHGGGVSGRLSRLVRMDLSDNQFSRLPVEALASLPSLFALNVAGNDIRRLAAGQLARALPSISELNVSGNQLAPLDPRAFSGLTTLRKLMLQDVGLERLEGGVLFSPLARLEELYLGQNRFQRLSRSSFTSLHLLRLVSVRACGNLSQLDGDVFASNHALQTILLEENPQLDSIAPETFLRLPLLQKLSLHANALTSLPSNAASWPNLELADLSGNPWLCDCQLLWLASLQASANVTGAVCSGPDGLQGRSVRSLSPAHLPCSGSVIGPAALTAAVTCALLLLLLLLLGVFFCHRHRCRLRKMLKAAGWREQVSSRRKEPFPSHTTTYYCRDIYDPLHQRDSRLVPVTEL